MERKEGRLEERNLETISEEAGQYIEMDLGLGVLEEKGDGSESEESEETESREDGDMHDAEDVDVLGRLMGFGKKGRRRDKPGIEVLGAVV